MKFHHIGWVVKDILTFEKQMVHGDLVKRVTDPVQEADLALYDNFGDSFVELIQPLNERAFTWAVLQKKGGHFHHICYEVESKEEMEKIAADNRLLLFKGPLTAMLFQGKPVYFVISRNRTIVEFLINGK